jgi:plasmid stabilization system protein ParE
VISHRYLPLAREDVNEAAAFYEASVPGLGDAFLDDVERAIQAVLESPRIGAPVGRKFRKTLLRRFPFSIVYADRGEEIVIVAVAHQRRRPGYWRGRQ